MFGRRRPLKPDPQLLARVSDAAEVDLGTYPDAALAVVGAYPARHGLDHAPDSKSGFRRLDTQARKAAMQSALDQLVAQGTLTVPAGTNLEKVVTDGLDGKLELDDPLGHLYELSYWLHRRGFQAHLILSMFTSDGLKGVPMPDGVCAPGVDRCFALPSPDKQGMSVLLVERPDNEAGTHSYTLRTVRAEFTRLAAFLFADVGTEEDRLLAATIMSFRIGPASLKVDADFFRKHDEDMVHCQTALETQNGRRKKKEEPEYFGVTADGLVDLMVKQFDAVAPKTQ